MSVTNYERAAAQIREWSINKCLAFLAEFRIPVRKDGWVANNMSTQNWQEIVLGFRDVINSLSWE